MQADFEFCPTCGQENHDLKVPIGHVVYEFIESVFHFDTKVWNTLRAISTKPGRITSDFVQGRRARYVPPARLYVFVAFFFFLMLNKVSDKWVKQAALIDKEAVQLNGTSSVGDNDWDLGNATLELRSLGYASGDSLEKALKDEAIQTQQATLKRIKLKAISDSTSKYGNRMPFRVRDALLRSFEAKDSILLRKSGFEFDPITDGLDLEQEIKQLTKLGVFRAGQSDSLRMHYGQMTAAEVYRSLWQLKDKMLDDSLGRFGGKEGLSLAFKTKLVGVCSMDVERDSILLQRAGINRPTYESLVEQYSTFTIEEVRLTKKQIEVFRTFDEGQLDSLLRVESVKYRQNGNLAKWFTRKLFKQGLKLNGSSDANTKEFIYKEFSHLVIKYVSFVMFLMMPVVALLLVMIFYRLRKYYYEHLIFSVHAHTVLFMLMTVGFTADYFFGLEAIPAMTFVGVLYFLVSLRHVYEQGWFKTTLKFLLLLMMYTMVAVAFLGGAVLFGFVNF